jgi:hypothetical protein
LSFWYDARQIDQYKIAHIPKLLSPGLQFNCLAKIKTIPVPGSANPKISTFKANAASFN